MAFELKKADKIEIIVLIDNYTNVLLPSSEKVERSLHYRNGKVAPPLLAEHGLSLLIKVVANGTSHSFLLDAGWSETGVVLNMRELGIKVTEVESIILSHGHMDHHGALKNILKQNAEPIPLIVHPDVFLKKRFIILPDGKKIAFPVLEENDLQEMGAKIIKNKLPYLIASDLALVTGEIERITDFEKGMPNAYLERAGKTEPDQILDDQAIVVHLKDKGLVVITGCAHSGIINTIRFAQKLTEISSVYAVIGGFHLTGPKFESIIPRTLAELKAVNPAVICPMHCTGWKATVEIANEMPQQFVLSSVGTKLIL